MSLMRLTWPVLEPPLDLLTLIDEAIEAVPLVVADMGYIATSAPREWEIKEGHSTRKFKEHRMVLTCVVEVQRVTAVAA